jgi:hypothetical protein
MGDPNGHLQMNIEGCPPQTAIGLMRKFADDIEEQLPPEEKPKPKSGLIVPQTVMPRDVFPKAIGGKL